MNAAWAHLVHLTTIMAAFPAFPLKCLIKHGFGLEPAGFCSLWPDLKYHKDVIFPSRRNAEICFQRMELNWPKFLQLHEYSMASPGPSHHNNACFSCFHLKVFNKAWINLESRIWGLDEYDMGSSGPSPCMNMSWAHLVQVHFTKACKVLNKARINLESAGFCYFWPHWSWTLASQKRYIQRGYLFCNILYLFCVCFKLVPYSQLLLWL